jgi:hypothetical protein
MALDVEKSPLSCTWRQLKPALIQIADGDRAFLLHSDMLASSAATTAVANRIFAALLGRGRTLAVFGDDDLNMLRKLDCLTLPAHPLCNFVDMKKMCLGSASLTAQAGAKRGLADWVAIKWPGRMLSKAWTLSGWDMPPPLLQAQLEYAPLPLTYTPFDGSDLTSLLGMLPLMPRSLMPCGCTARLRKLSLHKAEREK